MKFYVGKETFYMEHDLDRGPIVLLEAEKQAPEFITTFFPVGFFFQLATKEYFMNILERILETEFNPCYCQSLHLQIR